MFTSRRVDTQNVIYLYSEMVFSHKNELQTHTTGTNLETMVPSERNQTPKGHMLYESIDAVILETPQLYTSRW